MMSIQKIPQFVILGIVYFLIITPIGIIFRMFHRKVIILDIEDSKKSYWIECGQTNDTENDFLKQG